MVVKKVLANGGTGNGGKESFGKFANPWKKTW